MRQKKGLRFSLQNTMPTNKKPFIIPVFIPHLGCPHRCVFCNQVAITGQAHSSFFPEEIRNGIRKFLQFGNNRHGTVQIAFYGGNFLGMPGPFIRSCLLTGTEFILKGRVDSLRFSTRPDTVTPAGLSLLRDFPVSTIEIGVQSMNNEVLRRSARGHTADDTRIASERIKAEGYELGLQMMVGLPGDDRQSALDTGRQIADLSPDFVRIYPCVVLEHSPLERLWNAGGFTPLSLDQAVEITKELYILFKKRRIRVVRMGLQASRDFGEGSAIVGGPFHPAFGHMVISRIFLGTIRQALSLFPTDADTLRIDVHPKNISNVRGLKNGNIRILEKEFCLARIKVHGDNAIDLDTLCVQGSKLGLPWTTRS